MATNLSDLQALFAANIGTARGLAAAYQVLLGGVPTADGFAFLIGNARATNFGSFRSDIIFNDENIFINLVNSLVQGNGAAAARFDALTGGASTLAGQITAFYRAFVPAEAQSAAGLAYLTRPEALQFYAAVAAERGVAGDDGAAVVALASLLKILVDQDLLNIGDDVNDFIAAVADGTAQLGTGLTDIDIADGSAHDGDEGTTPPVDTPPTAVADRYVIDEDTILTEEKPGVLGNDTHETGTTLTASLVSGVAHGTLAFNADGSFSYRPDHDFEGVDSFSYTVSDGETTGNTVTVTLIVRPTADTPVALADSYAIAEDTTLTVAGPGVLANDSDGDGDALTAILVDDVQHGTLTLNADGSFSYTPDADFDGTDSFTYRAYDGTAESNTVTVNLTVDGTNDTPVSVADSYVTDEDTTLTIAGPGVLDNDTDADGDTLSAILVDDVQNGTLTLNSDGSFSYTPDGNYNGSDSFTYKVNDGTVDGNTVTVDLTVNAVNDAPVSADDSYVTDEETPLTVAVPGVLGNDSDPEGGVLTAVLVSGPTHGSLSFSSNGSFTYTPSTNYSGTDSFTYQANDGAATGNTVTVTLTVNPVNDAPESVADNYTTGEDTPLVIAGPGVLGNDTDPDGDALTAVLVDDVQNGTLTLNPDGSFTYTPDADYDGADSFTYRASDGTTTGNLVTVDLTVTAANDAPAAVGDSYSTNEDTPLVVAGPGVLGNDTDAEGDTLTAILVDDVDHGTLTLNTDGSFTYTPTGNYNGSDNFTYRANDGTANGNIVTVNLTVNAINDAPQSVSENYSASEDFPIVVAAPGVLLTDLDPDGDPLTAVLVSDVQHGTLVLNPNGAFNYTPDANFNGTDSFTYAANDGTTNGNTVTVELHLSPVNDAPVSAADSYSTDQNTPLTIAGPGVLGNDIDVDGNPLTASLIDDVDNGSLFFSPNGSFTYTPDAGFTGTDSFTYRAHDGTVNGNTVTVTLSVEAALPPVMRLTPDANNLVSNPSISGNGTRIVVASTATNITTPDTNGQQDIFLYDTNTGTLTNITAAANGNSPTAEISADGSTVVFHSFATNLDEAGTNGTNADVILYDVATQVFTNITAIGNAGSTSNLADVSADGSLVVLTSTASNLSATDTNGAVRDIFLYNVDTQVFTNLTQGGDANSSAPRIAGDGSAVTFTSNAILTPGDTAGTGDVFHYDVGTGTLINITQGQTGSAFECVISADGQTVAFLSDSTNLTANDTNARVDVFVYDVATDTLTNITGYSTGGGLGNLAISADGNRLSFYSSSTTLTAGDTNAHQDVFVYDRTTLTMTNVTEGGNGDSGGSALSADGSSIALISQATSLVGGATPSTYSELYLLQI